MESRTKLFCHPIHPMLIPFPLGLLATSLAFDLVHLLAGGEPWAEVSYWRIAAGIVGGLAALTGWLGGELVDRLGVGVDLGACLDAPSSLSGRPASERSSV